MKPGDDNEEGILTSPSLPTREAWLAQDEEFMELVQKLVQMPGEPKWFQM
jgi:antibiotic biosynthesis monooxygenase (ABM) superfamily enzyme